MNTRRRILEKLVNLYPPLLGAGIRSQNIDERTIRVRLKMNMFNRNLVGVHFGGSLYAMCDPWFMLLLMRALGKDYIVWDKSASIQFLKPGLGTVSATFHIPRERVDEIRAQADNQYKVEPVFTVDVLNEQGEAVARVEKLIYVRRKKSEAGN
jgi:acyl-coenzyme A thioesterase PaaI-like protein